MKIALINENSQAGRNSVIFEELNGVAQAKGYEVVNYGMFTAEDEDQLTYVQIGRIASILLTTKAVDFVVTGCGTGQGAMLACNSFPNVLCGHVEDPLDAFLFSQVNAGNCISMPYAQNYGWGGELNLRYTFEKLFSEELGAGYPKERVEPQQRNKKILDGVKKVTHNNLLDILKGLDRDLLLGAVKSKGFQENFFRDCQVQEIADYIKSL